MKDAIDAREKCDGIHLDGRRIRVDYSVTKRPHERTPGLYRGVKIVKETNQPPNSTTAATTETTPTTEMDTPGEDAKTSPANRTAEPNKKPGALQANSSQANDDAAVVGEPTTIAVANGSK